LYPIAKFAPFEAEKVVFSRIWVTLSIYKKVVKWCKVTLLGKNFCIIYIQFLNV